MSGQKWAGELAKLSCKQVLSFRLVDSILIRVVNRALWKNELQWGRAAWVQHASEGSAEMKLQDVARRAGVSIATVSRVLNESGPVKDSTRRRVLKMVKEFHYHPNIYARTLAGGKSQTVGMIVSNLENPFFLDIFRSIETEAHRANYELIVANTDYSPRRLAAAVRLMLGRRVDGLAVVVSEVEGCLVEELAASRVPVVFYDVGVASHNALRIRVNYARGMQKTVEYLYSLGHRRMAFVGHHTRLAPLHNRKESFLKTMRGYGDGVPFTAWAERDTPAGGQQAAHEMLSSGMHPTAILCVNDFIALGVLKTLRDRGLSVPGDVSVSGYDNIGLASFATPSLTSVHVPRERIGRLTFEALTQNGAESSLLGREIIIEPELIIRESTGPVARAVSQPDSEPIPVSLDDVHAPGGINVSADRTSQNGEPQFATRTR